MLLRQALLLGVTAVLLGGLPRDGWSQAVGTVSGTVNERGTGAPLAATQVSCPARGSTVETDANGRYTLTNLPAGECILRVRRLGYGPAQRAVTVVAGQSVVANIELLPQALPLDEVVITGTPGGTQRRAVGNVVATVAAETALELAPATDISGLMAFKSPAVSVMPSRGEIGSGAAIRIRGSSTLGLTSDPIVYIDGMRMNSSFGGPPGDGGATMSRMNDINPEDIQSIEIIKGPAAATLYGTEASSGVIQIITKRGAEGAPRFDLSVGQGATWFPDPAGQLGLTYGLDASGGLVSMNLYQHEADSGLGPVFQTGRIQNYSASAAGGTEQIRYFASASWDHETGIVDYNWLKGLSSRVNLSVMPRSDLTFNLNTAYMRSTTRKWQGFPDDIYRQLLWGGPSRLNTRTRGFARRTPESFGSDVEILAKVNRVITGFEMDHRPTSWLTQRLKLGVDVANEDNSRLVRRSPEGAAGIFGSDGLGRKLVGEVGATIFSVDYSGTVNTHLSAGLTSATSVGAQYFKRSRTEYSLDGRIFPSPGFETVGSMATTTSSEDFLENITVGTFAQQEFGWRDRVFVTGAVRGDDNSAFGSGFSAAIYPKFSATWVISEESFWPAEWVSKLRFRSAWGAAGRQPDVFDAPRLYDAVTGPGDQAGVTPSSFGNPDLKPERSEELEVGFDAGFLDDRIEFDYTYYSKVTKDAIVRTAVAPSTGFPGSQVTNIGQLSNWGHEFSLTARVLEQPKLSWEVGAQASLLHDRVDEIGTVDFIHVGDTRSASDHREGYPSQSVFFWRILSATLNPDGSTTNEICDGGTGPDGLQPGGAPVPCANAPKLYWGRSGNPTWEAAAFTTVTVRGNLRLHVRADGRGGSMFMDNDIAAAATTFINTSWSNLKDNAVYQAYRKIGREGLALTKAGFVKLRDVSVTYTLPSKVLGGVGASRASITVSGRNLAQLWQEQRLIELPDGSIVPDPPVRDAERRFTVESGTFNQAMVPPLRSVVTTIRWSF